MKPSIGLAVLAGGRSSRMGVNKAKQVIGNQTLIEHVISIKSSIAFNETLIITNTPKDYQNLNLPMVNDIYPEQGAVGGIHTALHHCQFDFLLILACDMPFVQENLIQYMIETAQTNQFQAIIPTVDGYPQAVSALYRKDALSIFEIAIQKGQRKLKPIVESLSPLHQIDEKQWQRYDPQGLSFMNINTPQDLTNARNIWENKFGGQISD